MTKDRRLGRGLAALLGTPIEESNSQDNASIASPKDTNANSSPANASTATARGVDPIARNQTIRALTDEAHQRTAASEHASRNEETGPVTVPMENYAPAKTTTANHELSLQIAVDQIDANPFQPRRHSAKRNCNRWPRVSRNISNFSRSWSDVSASAINSSAANADSVRQSSPG